MRGGLDPLRSREGWLDHHSMMKAVAVLLALVALLGVVCADRTLVVVDDLSIKDTHSTFFKSLTGMLRCCITMRACLAYTLPSLLFRAWPCFKLCGQRS